LAPGVWDFFVVWHKLSTGSIIQTARERDLFLDTRAICETNFRGAQVAHLVGFFHLKDIRNACASTLFPENEKSFRE